MTEYISLIHFRCEGCGLTWTASSDEELSPENHNCSDDTNVIIWLPEKEN